MILILKTAFGDYSDYVETIHTVMRVPDKYSTFFNSVAYPDGFNASHELQRQYLAWAIDKINNSGSVVKADKDNWEIIFIKPNVVPPMHGMTFKKESKKLLEAYDKIAFLKEVYEAEEIKEEYVEMVI